MDCLEERSHLDIDRHRVDPRAVVRRAAGGGAGEEEEGRGHEFVRSQLERQAEAEKALLKENRALEETRKSRGDRRTQVPAAAAAAAAAAMP
ncbi:hypothetical protein DFQ27_001040 [Actinomortierella ambigua]|uniref:Uncharacterized protein n=1 Tax=Actinomortierella ambigua TaxID=1343610 RepID=A0A9P6U9B7_9FUNG|nr:hypothetical protein DFQ27_001040 [Actinomortierella ambigua]